MFTRFNKILFEPPPSIKPGLPQIRARLLSGLTLGFLFVDILLTIRGELTGGASFHVYSFGALLLIVYLISRTKYADIGAYIWILLTSAIIIYFFIQANETSPERIPQGIGFVSLPIFLSLLLLPARITLGVSVVNFAVLVLFLQQNGIPAETIILPIISTLFFSIIAVITGFILEKDRLDIEDSNHQLKLAYEATLEGWAKTLEFKDRDTERHSQQVVHYTIQIAEALGLSDEEINNIRRGALLHDIGKMAIPDHILHKPGKLTDEEWEIMMKHPVYAYNFLSSIDYLQPALDIPLYHHERWDGSGYAKGLKGDQIPLPARIFSVVDVWDALSSDRPYRDAWERERVIQYLKDQSGKQFDPKIVNIFLSEILLQTP